MGADWCVQIVQVKTVQVKTVQINTLDRFHSAHAL